MDHRWLELGSGREGISGMWGWGYSISYLVSWIPTRDDAHKRQGLSLAILASWERVKRDL